METVVDDPIRTRAWIMERLGCSSEAVRRWIKEGRLPKPDVALSQKTTGWKQSTLDAAGIRL